MASSRSNSDEDDASRRGRLIEWFADAVERDELNLKEVERRSREAGLDLRGDGPEAVLLTWPGKRAASDLNGASDGMHLDPPVVNAAAQDQLIVGDNLPVMQLLNQAMRERVDLAYIDPPYNTGRGFTFTDRFPAAQPPRKEGGEARRQRSSSGWLNFLFPRLIALKDLMSERGVLVAHIDEHEHETLVMMCKEIFGEAGYLGSIVWDKGNPKGDARRVAYQHEHIVVFAKDPKRCPPLRRPKQNAQRIIDAANATLESTSSLPDARAKFSAWMKEARGLSGGESMYARISEDRRVYRLVSMAWPNKKVAPAEYLRPLVHPRTGHECPIPARGWRNPPGTMDDLLRRGLIEFGKDHTIQPQRRYFLEEHMHENIPSVIRFAGSDDERLRALGIPFEHPKPVELAARIVSWFAPPDAIVCDCFAGSGTTGHAVWEANARDGGTRRFVLIQAPEPIAGGAKKGEPTHLFERVDQITRARLERVAEQSALDERSPTLGFSLRRLVST